MRVRGDGFTLLELLVVILILSVVASIGVLAVKRSLGGIQVRTACRSLVQVMNYARLAAVEERIPYEVRFDTKAASYWLNPLGEEAETDKNPTRHLPPARFLPEGVFLRITTERTEDGEDGEKAVVFHPDGGADLAVIHVGDNQDYIHTLITSPATGQVRDLKGKIPAEEVWQSHKERRRK